MPAVVNNTVGSFSGIREEEGMWACFLLLKKSIYAFIRSWRVFIVIREEMDRAIKMFVIFKKFQ